MCSQCKFEQGRQLLIAQTHHFDILSMAWPASTFPFKLTRRRVSLLLTQVVVSGGDGLVVLNNGKHFIAALQDLQPMFEDAKQKAEAACPPDGGDASIQDDIWPEWLVPDLRMAFTDGVLLDQVKYSSDDRLTHVAIQCLAHETEQNRYRVSTIGDKVALVKKAFESAKDWGKAKKSILEVLGDNKASTVQRWIVLARDLDPEVTEWIGKVSPMLNQAYIVHNKYIIGKGDDYRHRMSAKYAVIAIQLLLDQLDSKLGSVSAPVFLAEFCAPLRSLEIWEKTQIRAFGIVASGFPAFHRVLKTHG